MLSSVAPVRSGYHDEVVGGKILAWNSSLFPTVTKVNAR